MRLIDADALRQEHCEGCNPDIQEDCKYDPICASLMWVNDAPTVDAIPVEQVARMLHNATQDVPCGCGYNSDEWCNKQNCMDSFVDMDKCWLHAIKEGWLDE